MIATANELPWLLDVSALDSPDAPALITPDTRLSYAALYQRVEAAAASLLHTSREISPGVRVALPASASIDTIVAFLALLRCGAVVCCLNPDWPEAYRDAASARADCATSGLSQCPLEPPTGPDPAPLVPRSVCVSPGFPERIPADTPAAVIMTSGSTGTPKAALLSYGNLYFNASYSNQNIRVTRADAWLLSLPLYHVSGIGVLFRAFLAGAAVVLPKNRSDLAATLADERITHISLVAAQLHRLLEQPVLLSRLQRLTSILLGGSAIPEPLIRRAHAAGLRVHTSYGMTEMASQVATTPPNAPLDKLLTSGKPLIPDVVRVSVEGEVQVSGPALFLGYVDGQTLTRPLTSDGFFRTGDAGFLDDSGYLHITGRRDNVFQVGGENVQPEEVERVLQATEEVEDAVVVPVADPVFGCVPLAFIRMRGNAMLSEDALRSALEMTLPRHKMPRHFLPWPKDLPQEMKTSRAEFLARAAKLLKQR